MTLTPSHGPRCEYCPRCEAQLPGDAPEGLCPACLFQGVLEETPAGLSAPGRYFEDFELLEEIGHGGMGLVYKVRQISLERTVALKLVRAGRLASEPARERFQREARALARLRHPNIVAVHEVGEYQGQPFFTMDYVEGTDLAKVIRQGPVDPAEAAGLVRRVAEAVHFAHQEGTLHRDLKPSNILIDKAGQPRITDFGIAKQLQGEHTLTLSGEALGTPGYMPPEQLGKSGARPQPASDVYSLGAILYELVTGKRPFDVESPLDFVMAVLHKDPDSPRLHRPEIDRDFETLCLKCLERDVARRYPTARDLADDLGRYLRNEPLSVRPVSRAERAWRWCRRNPWLTVAVLALFLLTVMSGVFAWTLRERLWLSLVDQARAERLAGRRQSSLERIAEAARLERSSLLREEAVRSLLTPGVEPLDEVPPTAAPLAFQGALPPGIGALPFQAEPLALFSDRELLLLANDGLVIHDLATGETRSMTPPPLAVSADGRVAVVPEGFGAAVLRLPEQTTICYLPMDDAVELRPGSPRSRRLLLSPDGTVLAVRDEDPWARKVAVVSLWDVTGSAPEGSRLLSRIVLEPGRQLFLDQAGFSSDGRLLAAAGGLASTHFVGIWDVETGTEIARLAGHGEPLWSAEATILTTRGPPTAARRTGRRSTTRSPERTAVFAWQVVSSPPGYSLSEEIRTLGFDATGRRLVANATVWSVDASRGEPRLTISELEPRGPTAGFGRGGRLWALEPSAPGVARTLAVVWPEAEQERPVSIPSSALVRATSTQMGPAGDRLAISGAWESEGSAPENFLGLWDLTTAPPSQVWLEERRAQEMGPLRFDPSGRILAAAVWGDDGHSVALWNTETGRRIREWDHDGPTVLAFSADGELLFVGGVSGSIEVGAVATGRRLRSWRAHAGEILALSVSPDLGLLASGGQDRVIRLWDPASGRELVHWEGHEGAVTALAFDPMGETLASGGADGRLRLWHVPSLRRDLKELGLDW